MCKQGIDIDALAWFGVFGPPGMPRATVDKLNASPHAALKAPDLVNAWPAWVSPQRLAVPTR